jgi:cell wall assembly regulator SMI1
MIKIIVVVFISLLISACDKSDINPIDSKNGIGTVKTINDKRNMKETANGLKSWFSSNHLEYSELFNSGASERDLNKLIAFFDGRLPDELIEFYRIVDGQSDLDSPLLLNGYVLLPSEEVINTWVRTKTALESMNTDGSISADFGPIKSHIQNLKWIPVASNIGGDSICIDLDPTETGTYGQVIRVINGDMNLKLLARSFKEFISLYERSLINGSYVFSDEYNMYIDPEDDEYLN